MHGSTMAKEAGATEAIRRFFGNVTSPIPATGAAGLAQKLFSTRVKPSDNRILSRVNILDGMREAVFGSPINMYRELDRYGRTPNGHDLGLALKRYYYRSIVPPGTWKNKSWGNKALTGTITGLNVLVPAVEVAGAATAPDEQRGEAVGRAASSIIAAPFTSRMGVGGAMLNAGAAQAGGALGRLFDPKPQPLPPEAIPQFQNG